MCLVAGGRGLGIESTIRAGLVLLACNSVLGSNLNAVQLWSATVPPFWILSPTVAILAQGTHQAVAPAQAHFALGLLLEALRRSYFTSYLCVVVTHGASGNSTTTRSPNKLLSLSSVYWFKPAFCPGLVLKPHVLSGSIESLPSKPFVLQSIHFD